MKRPSVLLAAILIFAAVRAAHAGKIDLPLKILLSEPAAGKALLGKAVSSGAGGDRVDVIIRSSETKATSAGIVAARGQVRSVIGDIMTASVPVEFITELAAREDVSGIEASKPLRILMDSARSNTGVDDLQSGSADGTGYDGANVIVGVLDSGLDFSRDDFKDSAGQTRVQYLRFQTAEDDGSMAITECVKSEIEDASCDIAANNDSASGHGSHVAGIAAGSDATYKGNAPAADIMFVRNHYRDDTTESGSNTYSAGVLDGVAEIFKKADAIDKPAVINISQGTHIGAHDDTSLMEQGINNAVAGQYQDGGKSYGRAVVVAAGNENVVADALPASLKNTAGGIHASISVSNGQSKAYRMWAIRVSSDVGGNAQNRTPLFIDVWFGSGQKNFCSVAGKVYAASKFNSTATGDAAASVGDVELSSDAARTVSLNSARKVGVSVAADSSDSQNSKPRAMFEYGPGTSGTWDDVVTDGATGYFLDVIVRASGGACSGDMWIEGAIAATYTHFLKNIDSLVTVSGDGGYLMGDGDSSKSVDLPGTASGVIAVGAYLQEKPFGSGRSVWTDIDKVQHDATDATASDAEAAVIYGGTIGTRAPFSSLGPPAYSYSGRKPDVLAPGDPVTSVMPTEFTPLLPDKTPNNALIVDDTHFKEAGTSQAAPQVAGIVALMFQKNNTLTAAEVKQYLTSTASKAASPNDSDGYGNVDAVAALAAFDANGSGYVGTGDLPPSSTTSTSAKKTCGIAAIAASPRLAGIEAFLILLPGVIIAARRLTFR